jgi:hypothetical protein
VEPLTLAQLGARRPRPVLAQRPAASTQRRSGAREWNGSCRLDELRLRTSEGLGVSIAGRDEHPDRRHRQIAASNARRVLGISSRARAVRTLSRAAPQESLYTFASHAAADRWPSRSNTRRRSSSASRRRRSTSSSSATRWSSEKSSSMRASGRSGRTSDRIDSTADRSSLTSQPRTCVRLYRTPPTCVCDVGHDRRAKFRMAFALSRARSPGRRSGRRGARCRPTDG